MVFSRTVTKPESSGSSLPHALVSGSVNGPLMSSFVNERVIQRPFLLGLPRDVVTN